MQANVSAWKTSIAQMEEVLYVAHQALQSRIPNDQVQLDKGDASQNRFQAYQARDVDGRPYILLQAVLHLDESLLDSPNFTWTKILETTTMSVPAIYLQ